MPHCSTHPFLLCAIVHALEENKWVCGCILVCSCGHCVNANPRSVLVRCIWKLCLNLYLTVWEWARLKKYSLASNSSRFVTSFILFWVTGVLEPISAVMRQSTHWTGSKCITQSITLSDSFESSVTFPCIFFSCGMKQKYQEKTHTEVPVEHPNWVLSGLKRWSTKQWVYLCFLLSLWIPSRF